MKITIKTAAIALLLVLTSCSKDDDTKTIEEPLSQRLEYLFDEVIALENMGGYKIIELEVDKDAKVIDPAKITVELRLQHQKADDVDYGYMMPNGEFNPIVVGLGGSNQYNPNNTLSFNSTHTETIANEYPNQTIPEGNYKSGSFNNENYPVETPLFQSTLNKNIKGTWQFQFLDVGATDLGKIYSIKLIFEEGALIVNDI